MCIRACHYRRADEADKAWCGWGLAWGDVRAAVEEPSRPTAGIRQPLPQIA